MKTLTTLILLFVTGIDVQIGFSQTQWTKYSSNPVLLKDTTLAGTWEWAGIGQPSCIMVNDTFRMYYVAAGVPSLADTIVRGRISYAYSTDGINWTKNNNFIPVLDVGASGEWDDEWLDGPEILQDATGYKLYYFGEPNYWEVWNPPPVSSAYGVATSTNGINWQKYSGNPVLQKGDSTEWDGVWVESPALYYDAQTGKYMLWYTGIASNYQMRIGLATSSNGLTWTKDTINNPVLDLGTSGSWDDLIVGVPAVIKSGNIFEMWYNGSQIPYGLDTLKIGYAVSLDGINWIKYPGNPILSINDPPVSTKGPWACDVVFDSLDNEYKMWYEAEYNTLSINIFLATSPKNILNSLNCITSISNDTTINPGDSITIVATGGTSYNWSPAVGLSNSDISNPVASPISTRTYTVLIVSDSCITTETVTVNIAPLGISNPSGLNNDIRIYPNPSVSEINIEIKNDFMNDFTVDIISVFGQKMKSEEVHNRNAKIDISNLPDGFYFITITDTQGRSLAKKIIKQRI